MRAVSYQRRPLAWELIGGEVVLINESTVTHLDASGTLLWQLLDEPVAVEDLVAVIRRIAGAPKAAVQRDVDMTLDLWRAQGMLMDMAD